MGEKRQDLNTYTSLHLFSIYHLVHPLLVIQKDYKNQP